MNVLMLKDCSSSAMMNSVSLGVITSRRQAKGTDKEYRCMIEKTISRKTVHQLNIDYNSKTQSPLSFPSHLNHCPDVDLSSLMDNYLHYIDKRPKGDLIELL